MAPSGRRSLSERRTKYGVSMSFSEERRSQRPAISGTCATGQYLWQVFCKGASGHHAVAAGLAGGDGQALLDVGEKADHGHAPQGLIGLDLFEKLQGLEAHRVEVENDEVRRGTLSLV